MIWNIIAATILSADAGAVCLCRAAALGDEIGERLRQQKTTRQTGNMQ